jgi:hypothetical protein
MELIELTANLAQQLGSGRQADEQSLACLRQVLQAGGDEAKLLKDVIQSLNVPQLERSLRRGPPILNTPGQQHTALSDSGSLSCILAG